MRPFFHFLWNENEGNIRQNFGAIKQ